MDLRLWRVGKREMRMGAVLSYSSVRVVKAKPLCFISWVKERGERGNKKKEPKQNPTKTPTKPKSNKKETHKAKALRSTKQTLLGFHGTLSPVAADVSSSGARPLPRPSPRVGRNFINFGY